MEDALCFLFPALSFGMAKPSSDPKVKLFIVLSLAGLITTIISILRMLAIQDNANGMGDLTNIVTYSSIELNTGIIMCCLPYFSRFVEKLLPSFRCFKASPGMYTSRNTNTGRRQSTSENEEELRALKNEREQRQVIRKTWEITVDNSKREIIRTPDTAHMAPRSCC
ncbi:Hypothetical protein D9617_46g064410 [Elsinoe fawcettii]|nr:Hypothetical protein D9617_46g064410 [Elsinoe fawcettii]